ncbi:Anthocyanidin 3-O-glucosyltransferase [Grifola frondosa]|uniref:Anthocyanidin 3-O-glucosyltransferase n=1 Tax=Grifola frondosa TaxID=5627 RepID=A0A1C7LR05_GRIFR|nr:Anthocyanidin 3-O-glucosyltransferase [Grifola frondosa]
MTVSSKHIVVFSYDVWGHSRPMCTLVAQMVRLRMIVVTFFTTVALYDRIKSEISRSFEPGEEHLLDRIRVIALQKNPQEYFGGDTLDTAFEDTYSKLISEEPLTCVKTGTSYNSVRSPDAAIVDFFATVPFNAAKKLNKKSAKVFAWVPGATNILFYFFGIGPGGEERRNLAAKVEAEVKRSGRPFNSVAMEVLFGSDGSVVRVPGLPPMYDHEYHPQDFTFPEDFAAKIVLMAQGTLEASDGVLLLSAEAYEPECVAAVREWFAQTSRSVTVCGPLLPSGKNAAAHEKQQSSEGSEIQKFLDSILESHGAHSLLYISFGSMFWPARPDVIWAFLDVVMELKIPFILSHASPLAVVPEEVSRKVREYRLGLLSPWTPQQTILDHSATGWHATNILALRRGPATQCRALTHNLDAAYELIEVRTGKGLLPILRTGYTPIGTPEAVRNEAKDVLTKAFGEDGERKRAKLQALKKALAESWAEDGPPGAMLKRSLILSVLDGHIYSAFFSSLGLRK